MNAHDVRAAEPGHEPEPSRPPIDLAWIGAQRRRARELQARSRVIRACARTQSARASGLLAHAIGVYLSTPHVAAQPVARVERTAAAGETPRVVRTRVVRTTRGGAAVGASARALPEEDAPEPQRWSGCPVLSERVVFDARDERWVVREVDARTVPGAHGERCLILENHERVRRLWVYPAGWARLPGESLLALGETGY